MFFGVSASARKAVKSADEKARGVKVRAALPKDLPNIGNATEVDRGDTAEAVPHGFADLIPQAKIQREVAAELPVGLAVERVDGLSTVDSVRAEIVRRLVPDAEQVGSDGLAAAGLDDNLSHGFEGSGGGEFWAVL